MSDILLAGRTDDIYNDIKEGACMKKQYLKIVAIALISFLAGGWFFLHYQSNKGGIASLTSNVATASDTDTGNTGVASIVDSVGPAVVYLEASGNSSNSKSNVLRMYGFNMPQQVEKATGSGFIINSDGYILTNEHVIDGASTIKVTVQGNDTPYTASVVGQDYDLDLAILKINASNLPIIPLGDSDIMRPGDYVIAIGNPLGLDHTVTFGVVSAKGRPITIEDRNYKNLIQTDAAINPGNSGGPLINMQGQVIAINTAVSTDAQGIGFAIPINTAKSVMQELMNTGKVVHPYMGISMLDMSSDIASQLNVDANTQGAVIAQVVNNSPASAAGLQSEDIVVSLDGNAVKSSSEVQDYIAKQQVGQTVNVGIIRNQQQMNVSVVLKEKP